MLPQRQIKEVDFMQTIKGGFKFEAQRGKGFESFKQAIFWSYGLFDLRAGIVLLTSLYTTVH